MSVGGQSGMRMPAEDDDSVHAKSGIILMARPSRNRQSPYQRTTKRSSCSNTPSLVLELDPPVTGTPTVNGLATISPVAICGVRANREFHGLSQAVVAVPSMVNRGTGRRLEPRVEASGPGPTGGVGATQRQSPDRVEKSLQSCAVTPPVLPTAWSGSPLPRPAEGVIP